MTEILCRATVGYGNARVGDHVYVDDTDPKLARLIGVYFMPVNADDLGLSSTVADIESLPAAPADQAELEEAPGKPQDGPGDAPAPDPMETPSQVE